MEDFIDVYKKAKQYKCVLMWSELFSHWVWTTHHRTDLELIKDFRL